MGNKITKDMTYEKLIVTYRVLGGASLDSLAVEDKFKMIDICAAMETKAAEFDKWQKEAREKLKDDQEAQDRYLAEKLATESNLELPSKISKDAFGKFLADNGKLPLSVIMIIKETIVSPD